MYRANLAIQCNMYTLMVGYMYFFKLQNQKYMYNECCKRALANASRHVFAFAQKY